MATPTLHTPASTSPIKLPQLPTRELGLVNLPAFPIDTAGMLNTLFKLSIRFKQREQALQGLSKTYTIGGKTARAREFLFGHEALDAKDAAQIEHLRGLLKGNTLEIVPAIVDAITSQTESKATPGGELTTLPLDDARQGTISWTTFPDVQALGAQHVDEWAATIDVTQPEKATEAFWPMIAGYGRSYNLLLPEKVRDTGRWRELFGDAWSSGLDAAADAETLYVIDLRVFETLESQEVAGVTRFTPSTVVMMVQDPATKAMTPESIRVAGGGNEPTVFSRSSASASAWVYALQAAKVSVTVFGIWLGHVYQWHLVTAAMLMTMFENLSPKHPVYRLLEPQSSYVIPFDDLLLLGWDALPGIPPTSIATAPQLLQLFDRYAAGREFFDDDPTDTLTRFGLSEADFSVDAPWDQFPIARDLLEIWEATGRYVDTYVEHAYATDDDVASDHEVRRWIAASGPDGDGNISGLPELDSKDALKRVLHSLIYRIVAHGGSRLYGSANPALTFVANFPPVLQDATIPKPDAVFDNATLLGYLPNTGSIGAMVYFYFTFWASPPYVPFVPISGVEDDLFFDDEVSNGALIELRRFIASFIERVEPDTPQIWQWERNIEL
ncbi:lipoxygenase family protein [Solirubrobacter soli]|uniref:lipoxygenase family protein n=1 Tax=Solirubrobacter soli TaxID=363832 RepID=UPI00041603F3|nr:lipoxygenase family protein [Solirubrobacter soli]